MPNAMQPFISPEVPLPDVPGALATGMKMRQMQNENALYPVKQQIYGEELQGLRQENALRQMSMPTEAEARTQKLMKKYTGPAFELQRQYERFLNSEGSREAAIAKMQPIWEPWNQKAVADGLPTSPTFNPETNAQFLSQAERLGFMKDETLKELGYLRADTAKTVAAKKAAQKAEKEEKLKEILGPYQKWATEEPEKWALATDLAAEGHALGRDKFQIQKIIGAKVADMDAAQLEVARAKKQTGGWGDFVLGLFGKKGQAATPAPGQQAGGQPPKGAVDTGRKSGGKPVWKLPDGNFWIQTSQSEPINLAMNAENVPLGTGKANEAKSQIQIRKELIDAIESGDTQKEAELRRQLEQITRQQKNIG